MNPNIFRQYDIRGIIGKEITYDDAEALGKAFAVYLKRKTGRPYLTVTIGRDARLSSPEIAERIKKGFNSQGVNVMDAGLVPTPVLYYGLFKPGIDGGVMITGSHNPAEYNGFKLCVGKETIYGDDIQKVRVIVENGIQETKEPVYYSNTIDLVTQYINHQKTLVEELSRLPKLKIAVDSGNGTAGLIAPDLYRNSGCEVYELFSAPDGTFPNHHPDPTVPANLTQLKQAILENGCDFGLAFDGDADRLGVLDANGEIIWGDKLLALFSYDILKQQPGAKIIGEVKCSQTVFDFINDNGGNALMGKTGHSLIKAEMKRSNAVLAGEMSGHFFFADKYFGFDDAIYAGLRFIELAKKLSVEEQTIESLLNRLPRLYSTPEIRIDCADEEKFNKVELAKKHFKQSKTELGIREIIEIDGARIVFEDGWGLVRASNTQPALIMRFEATSEDALEAIKRHFDFLV